MIEFPSLEEAFEIDRTPPQWWAGHTDAIQRRENLAWISMPPSTRFALQKTWGHIVYGHNRYQWRNTNGIGKLSSMIENHYEIVRRAPHAYPGSEAWLKARAAKILREKLRRA